MCVKGRHQHRDNERCYGKSRFESDNHQDRADHLCKGGKAERDDRAQTKWICKLDLGSAEETLEFRYSVREHKASGSDAEEKQGQRGLEVTFHGGLELV